MHCSTGQSKVHSALLSAALQNRITAILCQCSQTYGDLLCIQVCNDPTTVHCNTVQGKMHSALLSAALQNRLTAGFCHCIYTYGDLLFVQVCSEPTAIHCSTCSFVCRSGWLLLYTRPSPQASYQQQHLPFCFDMLSKQKGFEVRASMICSICFSVTC